MTYYEYDRYNSIVKTTDKEGDATTYEHDNNGNVTAVISALGKAKATNTIKAAI